MIRKCELYLQKCVKENMILKEYLDNLKYYNQDECYRAYFRCSNPRARRYFNN